MTYRIEGPLPITVQATTDGVELGLATFLRTVFLELIEDAAGDPVGFGEELADLHAMSISAQHGGPDSHVRHEFDERMDRLLDRYADGGKVGLYATGTAQLLAALREIAAPRPVPSQERRRTA
ncbi:hypothetical protein AB0I66_21360 [Streptomyces sp. NPDC050439]|uniref:hypothetical protein n=1 Tax=unclassified Streptomyces TaxID=2593676 RepID=UPI003428EB14